MADTFASACAWCLRARLRVLVTVCTYSLVSACACLCFCVPLGRCAVSVFGPRQSNLFSELHHSSHNHYLVRRFFASRCARSRNKPWLAQLPWTHANERGEKASPQTPASDIRANPGEALATCCGQALCATLSRLIGRNTWGNSRAAMDKACEI